MICFMNGDKLKIMQELLSVEPQRMAQGFAPMELIDVDDSNDGKPN